MLVFDALQIITKLGLTSALPASPPPSSIGHAAVAEYTAKHASRETLEPLTHGLSCNIAIRQTWIEEHTTKLAAELKESEDDAFLYLAASLLLGTSPDDIEAEDIVDGAQDKQVDFIHIEDNSDGEAEIVIIQSKNTRGFGSNS